MTSDELLRWADKYKAENEHPQALPDEAEMVGRLAARIRELEAERDEAVTQMVEAKMANKGVADGTRVIVPVEPTPEMLAAARIPVWGEEHYLPLQEAYRAMIRAAQPDKPQQGE